MPTVFNIILRSTPFAYIPSFALRKLQINHVLYAFLFAFISFSIFISLFVYHHLALNHFYILFYITMGTTHIVNFESVTFHSNRVKIPYDNYPHLINIAQDQIHKQIKSSFETLKKNITSMSQDLNQQKIAQNTENPIAEIMNMFNFNFSSMKNDSFMKRQTSQKNQESIEDRLNDTKNNQIASLSDLMHLNLVNVSKQTNKQQTVAKNAKTQNQIRYTAITHPQFTTKKHTLLPLPHNEKLKALKNSKQIMLQQQNQTVQRKQSKNVQFKKGIKVQLSPITFEQTLKKSRITQQEAVNKMRANIQFIERIKRPQRQQIRPINQWKSQKLVFFSQDIKNKAQVKKKQIQKNIVYSASKNKKPLLQHLQLSYRLPNIQNNKYPKKQIPFNLYNIQMRPNELYVMK